MRLLAGTREEDKPEWLLAENVKNLLSIGSGFDFLRLLIEMDAAGYDVEWQLLNSKDFNVPQNRERVFIIGHLRGRGGGKVFPISGADGANPTELSCIGSVGAMHQATAIYDGQGLARTLQSECGGLGAKTGLYTVTDARAVIDVARECKNQNGRIMKDPGEPMFTLTAQDRHGVAILTKERTEYGKKIRKAYESGEVTEQRKKMTQYVPRTDGLSNTITTVQKDNYLLQDTEIKVVGNYSPSGHNATRVLDPAGLAPTVMENHGSVSGVVVKGLNTDADGNCRTLKAQCAKNSAANFVRKDGLGATCVLEGVRIRKLTPRETWRLQGFPDEYFDRAKAAGVSNSQLYKQAGNAVTVTVAYAIAKKMAEVIKEKSDEG